MWVDFRLFSLALCGVRRARRDLVLENLALRQQRMVRENPTWGVTRIRGELQALGIAVGATTVRRYRREALRRPPSASWRSCLRLHAPDIWAADFFTVRAFASRTLDVCFVISHDRRRIVHWNVTGHPTAAWVWRQIIAATPCNQQPRYCLRDRDASSGGDFVQKAGRIGIKTIVAPVRTPTANAIAERIVGTIRRECPDHVIVLNERHLRHLLREYVADYNAARPHQTLGLHPPNGQRSPGAPRSAAMTAYLDSPPQTPVDERVFVEVNAPRALMGVERLRQWIESL